MWEATICEKLPYVRSYHMWEEATQLFSSSPSSKRDQEVALAEMQLGLADVILPNFLSTKFCVWLDLQTADGKGLHGIGRRIENGAAALRFKFPR